MAPKKSKSTKRAPRVSQLEIVTTAYSELRAAVQTYFNALKYRRPEAFSITLSAKTDDKDTMIRVSSLMSSVLTGAGLGKEVRLVAMPAADGGSLSVQFFTPVAKPEPLNIVY